MASGTFRLSPTQPRLADGSNVYEMQSTSLVHARAVGGNTHTGIKIKHRPSGTTEFSALSTYTGSYTTPAAPGVAPTVDSIAFTNSAYTTGQTATVQWTISPGNGTGLTRTLEILRDATVVQTTNPSTNTGTADWVTAGTGTLTARMTVTSSAGTNVRTSAGVTLAAAAVDPVASAPTLDKAAYTPGETAVATAHYTLGSGSLTSRQFLWNINAVLQETDDAASDVSTFMIPADTTTPNTLTVDFTVTTSVNSDTETSASIPIGTPPPAAPDANDWAFVEVISAPGLMNRFTGRFHFPVGSDVTEAGVLSVQWSTDRANWFPTVAMAVWTDGTKTWRLNSTTNVHSLGYSETSSPIFIRYATTGGTSAASATGKTFTAPAPPPNEEDDDPPAKAEDADWSIPEVVEAVGIPNRYTGQIRFEPLGAIDDADVVSVEWLGAGNIWLPTRVAGTDIDGKFLWEMQHPEGISHTLGFADTRADIFIRYSTETGRSEASVTAKGFSSPAAPAYVDDIGNINIEIGGKRLRRALPDRPSQVVAIVPPTVVGTTLTFTSPTLPLGGVAFLVRYNGRIRQGTSAFTFTYQSGVDELYLNAVSANGTCSVTQIVRF